MIKKMKKVSVSIVTYNNQNEIEGVLRSLFETTLSSFLLEVNILDNNSSDNTVLIVSSKFPNCKIFKINKNLGYGAGHNQIIKNIDSDYHIIVNPDITFRPDTISKLIDYMDTNSDVVVCSPKVLNKDGSPQFLPKKRPTIKFLLGGPFENKGKIFKKWRDEFTFVDKILTTPVPIDFCTGCFMFCNTSALKKCKGFDERYFMYFEDADLTREMQKYGKTMYNPNIEVFHEWKRENQKLNGRLMQISSMIKYFLKWGFW